MYKVILETRYMEGAVYQAFGVASPSGRRIGDLSSYEEKVTRFTAKLNLLGLDEIHLKDCIDDFLLE